MPPRILYAGLFHETHSFVDGVTRWQDFTVTRGPEILSKCGDASVADGFLQEAGALGLEIVPTIDVWATPGGTIDHAAFEQFWTEFETPSRPLLAAGNIDGIFLVLHGAMATTACDDPEGVFISRIRELPGAATLPIFGVLDLHANVSAAMCRHANGLLAYRENPHTDGMETARRATALLARAIRERITPHMTWCRPPIVWTPPGTATAADPMRALETYARRLETEHASAIWACNIVAGFSFSDTRDTGLSLSVISTGPRENDRCLLDEGARLAWGLREKGRLIYPPVDNIVASLADAFSPAASSPTLLVEPSDNIGGGAPGDGTGILRPLLKHRIPHSLVVINDPAAVAALVSTPIGGTQRLFIGGHGSRLDEGPVAVNAQLVSRNGGAFELEDKQSHLAAMSGARFDMGNCAVIRCGENNCVTVLLTSRKTPPFDLGQLRSQGIEPRDYAVIGVKAAVAHKRAYDPIAGASHYVDTPGPCTGNLARLPFRNLHRPVWPLDDIATENFSCQFS